MSFGFGFALPAYPLRGGGGNNPFNQLGPTLDLSFTGVVTDLTDPNGYTLNTDFIIPQYQIAAQYVVWETGVGLVDKTFSQIITFTRASTGTYFDSAGVLQSAAINAPRFDYNPSTLAAQGFLIEEARTNLLTYSEQFDNAIWGPIAGTVTANATTAPSGAVTADRGVTSGVNFQVIQAATITSGATVSGSVFLKADGINEVELVLLASNNTTPYGRATFNVSTGVISTAASTANGGTNVSASITAINNGWYRCVVTVTYPATTSAGMRINAQGATGGIFLWGAQLEAGAFPTSYIPTTTAAVPRSADVASVNTLSPWYNATEGTLFAQYIRAGLTASGGAAGFDDGTANNMIRFVFGTAAPASQRFDVNNGGVSQAAITVNAAGIVNTLYKDAGAYKLNDIAATESGAPVSVDTVATIPTVNILRLGTNPIGAYLNGWIQRFTYYPRRLTNAELQTITLPTGATITTQDYSLDTNFVGNTVAIGS